MKLSNSTIAFYFSLFMYGMLFIFFFAVLPGCATTTSKPQYVQGDNYAYTKSYMSKFIQEQMDEYDMVGVSVALVDGSQPNPVVWAKGFGYEDKENKRPATANTLYRAGSTTKLFTASAIMQLAEQGKLDIDKPIQTYLPHITIRSRFENAAPVTIRNMLTHHSGLPGDVGNAMWGDATADISHLGNQTYDLASQPNTQHAYSNLAMSLLGLVVENVSGMPYERYIKDNLLTPMGMSRSYVSNTLSAAKGHSKGYINGKSYPLPALRDTPAGGLNASVLDLAKFAQMTLSNGKAKNGQRILSAKTLATMQRKQMTSHSPFADNTMGLAWFLKDVPSEDGVTVGQSAGHNGATMMFNTVFSTLPEQNLAVVVMANGVNDDGVGTGEIAEKLMQLAIASKSGVRMATDQPLPKQQPIPAIDLARMPGTWVSGDLGSFDIKRKGDKLKAVVNKTEVDLVNRGGHTYYLEYKLLGMMSLDLGMIGDMGITYQKYGEREVLKIHSPSLIYNMHAEKVKAQPLSSVSDIWKTRLGKYEKVKASGVIFQDVALTHENGMFKIKMKAKPSFSKDFDEGEVFIQPINETQAIVPGVGRNTGDVVNFKTRPDGHLEMHYLGYVYQK